MKRKTEDDELWDLIVRQGMPVEAAKRIDASETFPTVDQLHALRLGLVNALNRIAVLEDKLLRAKKAL